MEVRCAHPGAGPASQSPCAAAQGDWLAGPAPGCAQRTSMDAGDEALVSELRKVATNRHSGDVGESRQGVHAHDRRRAQALEDLTLTTGGGEGAHG